MKNPITSAIVLLTLLASCAKPVISNLEKGTYKTATAPAGILNVSVSILPLPKSTTEPEKPKTFFDLRDSLPHLYLNIMAAKTQTADELITLLSKPLSGVEKPKGEKKQTDFTEYKVRFAFSNLKKYYTDASFMHPNTRLEFLTTTLTIPTGSGVTLYNIDKLENEFDEIDLGTLSRDQTVALNAKLGVTGGLGTSYGNTSNNKSTTSSDNKSGKSNSVYDEDGNVIGTLNTAGAFTSSGEKSSGSTANAEAKINANLEGSYANTVAIKEAIAVKLKRLRTGFNFTDNSLTIAQRGRPLGDISDNIYVTATLKVSNSATVRSLNVYSFDKLYDENNKPNKASEILFSVRNVNFSPCHLVNDIGLTTSFEGAVRAVENDNNKNAGVNALEYDDKVTYYTIASTAGNPLTINKNLFCKKAYKYTASINGASYVLKIAAPTADEVDVFVDDAPELLLQWLTDIIANPVAAQLTNNKFILYFEDIANPANKIFIVKSTMTSNDIMQIKTLPGVRAEIKP